MKQKKIGSNIISSNSDYITHNFTIEEQAQKQIVTRLTDLYKQPFHSMVRELVSNAIDSALKTNGKVIIDYDNSSDNLTISDTGLGMSYEDLKNIYTSYGNSTKTEDFSTIGAYGLGAKSPLAYTDNFIIKTVSKEEIIEGVVTRTEELPKLVITKREPNTNTPTGTSIKVLVRQKSDVDSLKSILEDNYLFYKNLLDVKMDIKGLSFNKQKKALSTKVGSLNLGDNINADVYLYHPNDNDINSLRRLEDISFVLGGWDYTQSKKYYVQTGFVVNLPYGVVDFSSSREEIIKNDRYNQLLEKVKDFIKSKDVKKTVFKYITEYSKNFPRILDTNNGYFSDFQFDEPIYNILTHYEVSFVRNGRFTRIPYKHIVDKNFVIVPLNRAKCNISIFKEISKQTKENYLIVPENVPEDLLKNSGAKCLSQETLADIIYLNSKDEWYYFVVCNGSSTYTKRDKLINTLDRDKYIFVPDETLLRPVQNYYPNYIILKPCVDSIQLEYIKCHANYVDKKLEPFNVFNDVAFFRKELSKEELAKCLVKAKNYENWLPKNNEFVKAYKDKTNFETSLYHLEKIDYKNKELLKEALEDKISSLEDIVTKQLSNIYNKYLEEYNKRLARKFPEV